MGERVVGERVVAERVVAERVVPERVVGERVVPERPSLPVSLCCNSTNCGIFSREEVSRLAAQRWCSDTIHKCKLTDVCRDLCHSGGLAVVCVLRSTHKHVSSRSSCQTILQTCACKQEQVHALDRFHVQTLSQHKRLKLHQHASDSHTELNIRVPTNHAAFMSQCKGGTSGFPYR